MALGWVEIYDDEKLGGQGVRALRDIHMPASKLSRLDVTSLHRSRWWQPTFTAAALSSC